VAGDLARKKHGNGNIISKN